MDLFDVLSLLGGLALFLFGMNLMGQALEKRAGSKLKTFPAKPIRIMPVSLRLALFWNIYRTIPIIAKIGTKDDGLSS